MALWCLSSFCAGRRNKPGHRNYPRTAGPGDFLRDYGGCVHECAQDPRKPEGPGSNAERPGHRSKVRRKALYHEKAIIIV